MTLALTCMPPCTVPPTQVPLLAGASLALVTLGYGPLEWAAAVVFGVSLCSRLPQVGYTTTFTPNACAVIIHQ